MIEVALYGILRAPMMTLGALLCERAKNDADRLAFAVDDARLTFAGLFEEASAVAAAMAQAGVEPGDRVVLLLPAGLDFVRHFYAIQLLAATSCAMNPYVPEETALRRAQKVRPRLIVTAPLTPSSQPSSYDLSRQSPDAIAFLQPTSGTSGESRFVMVSHRAIAAIQRSSEIDMGMSPADILVSWVPPWHDLGLVRFMIGPVSWGGSCHIVPPAIQTIPQWLAKVSEVRATTTGAPDFAWRLAARLVDPAKVDLTSLRHATNGGEPVRLSTITTFEERFGLRNVIRPGYGLAEATLGVSTARPGEPLRTDARGNVACGRPLSGVEVRLAEDGEILVRGASVFAGYFEAEEATARTLLDGWLHTGDIGSLDADGHLYVLGRKRAMLKRGGAVLAPRELEEVALTVAGVKLAAAVGIARETTEEIVVAVEIEAHAETDSERLALAVVQALQRALGFAPERVVVLKPRTIARTYNGKIRHDVFRNALAAGELDEAIVFSSSGRANAG
ncbi:MAG TPA: AMP-binding protein [Thermoanaerobaculia bacterium]